MAKPSAVLAALTLSLLFVAIAAGDADPAHTNKAAAHVQHAEITHATAQKKLAELKLHHVSLKSQSLQANGTEAEGQEKEEKADDGKEKEDDADSGIAVAEGVAEGVDDRGNETTGDDADSKAGFWKKIIGGNSMVPGQENHHPDRHVPSLVWVLPIVAAIGVGIAITAYCTLAT